MLTALSAMPVRLFAPPLTALWSPSTRIAFRTGVGLSHDKNIHDAYALETLHFFFCQTLRRTAGGGHYSCTGQSSHCSEHDYVIYMFKSQHLPHKWKNIQSVQSMPPQRMPLPSSLYTPPPSQQRPRHGRSRTNLRCVPLQERRFQVGNQVVAQHHLRLKFTGAQKIIKHTHTHTHAAPKTQRQQQHSVALLPGPRT